MYIVIKTAYGTRTLCNKAYAHCVYSEVGLRDSLNNGLDEKVIAVHEINESENKSLQWIFNMYEDREGIVHMDNGPDRQPVVFPIERIGCDPARPASMLIITDFDLCGKLIQSSIGRVRVTGMSITNTNVYLRLEPWMDRCASFSVLMNYDRLNLIL